MFIDQMRITAVDKKLIRIFGEAISSVGCINDYAWWSADSCRYRYRYLFIL